MNEKSLALVPRSVREAEHMAVQLSKSLLVPDVFRGKPADVFMAISYGLELGIPPVASLRAVSVIKGKPALYADAMVGLILASGLAEYFVCIESNGESATYETKRRGAPKAQRKTFTREDAKQAGLLSNRSYNTYPKQMLEARAKSWLARDVYPDRLHGIYSAEEVQEFEPDLDSPPREVAVVPPPIAAKIADAEIVDVPTCELCGDRPMDDPSSGLCEPCAADVVAREADEGA